MLLSLESSHQKHARLFPGMLRWTETSIRDNVTTKLSIATVSTVALDEYYGGNGGVGAQSREKTGPEGRRPLNGLALLERAFVVTVRGCGAIGKLRDEGFALGVVVVCANVVKLAHGTVEVANMGGLNGAEEEKKGDDETAANQ